ncbi:MAG: hypothetical protein ACOVRN_18895 [Flavobacterium sp.]
MSNIADSTSFLPLLNAVLITDLFVISLLNMGVFKSNVLKKWYSTYNLSAVIADVLIILIVLIITRAIYYKIFDTFSLFNFIILAIILQVIHDILFAILFSTVPRGVNRMLDTFKDYANEMSYRAVFADSGMMIMSSLIAAYLLNKNNNTNIIVLISFLYLMPYLLYN